MIEFRDWLAANRPLVLFVYGLAFFVLGLAIVLQSRRYSRLELARSLSWLAAFGFLHAANEWGDLFIPYQSAFLSESAIHLLRALQLLLLAASFACLMQFGVDLLQPLSTRWQWLRLAPAMVTAVWLIGPFAIGFLRINSVDLWEASADAWARYLIGFPASLWAAYSLRRYARERIQPLGLPRIYRMLRVAWCSLAAYAVLAGLIVPPAPFFPANSFNSVWIMRTFVIPPQVLRAGAASVLAVSIIRALEVFEVETDRLIERMEQAQIVAIERERIGRDLHDGALQRIYAAGLLAASLRKKADGPQGDGLERLMGTLNEAMIELRHYMTDLRNHGATSDLAFVLGALVDETRRASGLEVRWIHAAAPPLPPDRVTHVAAFAREALSNAVRHAEAHAIEVQLEQSDGKLRLIVRDDGRGFSAQTPRGYGLRNMRDRARLLGGEIAIASQPGHGTTVTLTIPLEVEA
jgi:signal transduction histidine kinase